MGPIRCAVKTCYSSSASKHRFPNPKKFRARFNEWIRLVGNSNLLGRDPESVYANFRICSLHFVQEDLGSNNRLKYEVVPSVNLPAPLEHVSLCNLEVTRSPLKELQNVEHNTSLVEGVSGVTHYLKSSQTGSDLSQALHPEDLPGTSAEIGFPQTPKRRSSLLAEVNATNTKDLSPKAMTFYKKVRTLRKKIWRMKKVTMKKRLQLQNHNPKNAVNMLISSMDRIRSRFFQSQVDNLKKRPKGRRYTLEDKILALALYKQSGSAYHFLRKIFCLPSRKTVTTLLNRIPIETGLHEEVFQLLRAEVKNFKNPLDHHCCIMFDEMSIQAHLQPNFQKGTVAGFENFGFKTTEKIANHAQVFMLRGIRRKWKQPVYYNFAQGATKNIDIVNILKQIVRKCHSIGLNVVSVICDQGSNNRAALNYLVKNTRRDYNRKLSILEQEKEYSEEYFSLKQKIRQYLFEIDGKIIIPIYDIPHVFKGIRNNLLKYNLHFEDDGRKKVAIWEDIFKAYKMDPYLGSLRLMPKITDRHVNPQRIDKMKVAKCTQVFSHSVAQAINVFAFSGTVVETGEEKLQLDKRATDTADLLSFLDSLFDSLNGKSFKPRPGKILRTGVTSKTKHLDYWSQSVKRLRTFRFKKEVPTTKLFRPPSLINLIRTINNFKTLFTVLTGLGFKHLMPRTFNQDPLENFFGKIRQRGSRNISPTAVDFSGYYKSLLVNSLTSQHSVGANCEDDNSEVFLTLQRFVAQGLPEEEDCNEETFVEVPLNLPPSEKSIEAKVLTYVAGYVMKAIGDKQCTCVAEFYAQQQDIQDNEEHDFVRRKEYNRNKPSLKYVNSTFLHKMKLALAIMKYIFNRNFFKKNVASYTLTILKQRISFTNCFHDDKLKTRIFNYFIKVNMFNYCTQLNRILKGTDLRNVPKTAPTIFKEAKDLYLATLKRKKKSLASKL